MYTGIDVSYAQADYHPGAENFVIINASRANNGPLEIGSYYHEQVDNALAAGKEIGHYFFNGNQDAPTCARFFIANLYRYAPGHLLVLDVESEPASGTVAWSPAQVLQFAQVVHAATGEWITVYLNQSIMLNSDWSAVVAAGCPLWIAYYSSSAPSVRYWPAWSIWQHASVPLDQNVAQETLATIAQGKGPEMTPEEHTWLLAVYQAVFSGGPSMPDGNRSVGQSLADIAAHSRAKVSRSSKSAPVALPANGAAVAVTVEQDNADTNTMVRELLTKPAVVAPPVDVAALAAAVVAELTAKLPTQTITADQIVDDLARRLAPVAAAVAPAVETPTVAAAPRRRATPKGKATS